MRNKTEKKVSIWWYSFDSGEPRLVTEIEKDKSARMGAYEGDKFDAYYVDHSYTRLLMGD